MSEVDRIKKMCELLDGKDIKECSRILEYLWDRYVAEPIKKADQVNRHRERRDG